MKRILITLALLLTFVSLVHPVGSMDGAQDGVALDNLAVIQPSDKVYYVDAADAQSSRGNGTFELPFSTIDGAINYAVAGSIILVKGTHTETITTVGGIDADKIGLIIRGIGPVQPVITVGDDVTDDIDIDAASITFDNLKFVAGFDALLSMIDVNADNFTLKNCTFDEASSIQVVEYVDVSANACVIKNNRLNSVAAGASQAIEINGTHADIVVEGNFIFGDFTNAGLQSAAAFTEALIKNNTIVNTQTGDHAIQLSAAATGVIQGNMLAGDTAGAVLDPGSAYCFENYEATNNSKAAVLIP